MTSLSVLAAGGDVGGARALFPVLRVLRGKGVQVEILDRGVLSEEAPADWPRVGDAAETKVSLFNAFVFATSAHDAVPLSLARAAQRSGLPVVCVLDNWMNYRYRLEVDGGPAFIPDVYAVMDDFAKKEAIREGVPERILHVTGHPGLSQLSGEYRAMDLERSYKEVFSDAGVDVGERRCVVFVSEPVTKDQGSDPAAASYRGYTEETVLRAMCSRLEPYADRVVLGVLPHPREDRAEVEARWNRLHGRLGGGLLSAPTGRYAMMASDGVLGMASLLLYEAMLLGKPVMSVQPDLRTESLRFLERKGLEWFVTSEADIRKVMAHWVGEVMDISSERVPHSELCLHERAPETVAQLIIGVIG